MKAKLVLSMLTLLLVGILIGGGTMAWFTADAEVDPIVFKAGTVEIDVGSYLLEGPNNLNWNPGDCNEVEWDIWNTGSKNIELKVNFDGEWSDELSDENINFSIDDEDWKLCEGNYYYTGGPVAEGEFITIAVKVCLDGASTGNEYMDAEFEFSGMVEAVQASNDAPGEVWGDCWEVVNSSTD